MNNNSSQSSIWKKIEKFFGVVGFIAAIAAIFGLYYQLQNKKSEIRFTLISKDYLTVKNNVEGLESNYKYIGQPVKNLWLLKFRIVNSGDLTLIGTDKNSSLLDSVIQFKFPKNVQILDKVNLINNKIPEHKISKYDLNTLFLSFKQWRPNETAIYSIYVKSNISNPKLLPKTFRTINDGNIIIEDLTSTQVRIKQPLIDFLFEKPAALCGRILGIVLGILLFLTISVVFFGLTIPEWIRLRIWLWKNSKKFNSFILSYDSTKILNEKERKEFINNLPNYLKDPTLLNSFFVLKDWKNSGNTIMPNTSNTPTTWKGFIIIFIIVLIFYTCNLSIITGLWLF